MCEKCVEAATRYFPNLSEHEIGELLMGATAFPFGDAEYIEKQLAELKEKTDGTLDGALTYAANQLHEDMRKFH